MNDRLLFARGAIVDWLKPWLLNPRGVRIEGTPAVVRGFIDNPNEWPGVTVDTPTIFGLPFSQFGTSDDPPVLRVYVASDLVSIVELVSECPNLN